MRSIFLALVATALVVLWQIPGSVLAIPTGPTPAGLDVNPVTNELYVGLNNYGAVQVFDAVTSRLITSIGAPLGPANVAINISTNRVYAGDYGASDPYVIDGATHRVIATIPVGGTQNHVVAVNEATNRVYVTNSQANQLTVVDGATSQILDRVPVESQPYYPAVNVVTNYLYVANNLSDSISVVDGSTDRVIGRVPVGHRPYGVAVNPSTNRIYVTNNFDNSVSVIDGATNTVIATIPVAISPVQVAVNTATNHIYVSNNQSNSMSVIDGDTNKVVQTVLVGGGPNEIGIDKNANRVYVANYASGNVSVVFGSELLRNSSFEKEGNGDARPDHWRRITFGPGDLQVKDPVYEGQLSLQVIGVAGVKKHFAQVIDVSGTAGTTLNLEAFSKSQGTSQTGGAYKIRIDVTYLDDTLDSFTIIWPKDTQNWKRRATSFTATKDYKRLMAHIIYEDQTGTVWFDALHLWPSP